MTWCELSLFENLNIVAFACRLFFKNAKFNSHIRFIFIREIQYPTVFSTVCVRIPMNFSEAFGKWTNLCTVCPWPGWSWHTSWSCSVLSRLSLPHWPGAGTSTSLERIQWTTSCHLHGPPHTPGKNHFNEKFKNESKFWKKSHKNLILFATLRQTLERKINFLRFLHKMSADISYDYD